MAFQAKFKHGRPLMVDYTPSGAVAAGDVIIIGQHPRIAHNIIAASALGALAAGGGVYTMTKAASDGGILAGQRVFWDDTNNVVTKTETGLHLGFAVATALTADVLVDVIHQPGGAGLRFVSGVHTTVAASDTKVTGLATVVSCGASMASDPVDNPFMASATIGDQAGTPAAGSILIKTWQNTSGSDPTPAAASTFSKLVNWYATGY